MLHTKLNPIVKLLGYHFDFYYLCIATNKNKSYVYFSFMGMEKNMEW